jgi:hypothetical protein
LHAVRRPAPPIRQRVVDLVRRKAPPAVEEVLTCTVQAARDCGTLVVHQRWPEPTTSSCTSACVCIRLDDCDVYTPLLCTVAGLTQPEDIGRRLVGSTSIAGAALNQRFLRPNASTSTSVTPATIASERGQLTSDADGVATHLFAPFATWHPAAADACPVGRLSSEEEAREQVPAVTAMNIAVDHKEDVAIADVVVAQLVAFIKWGARRTGEAL